MIPVTATFFFTGCDFHQDHLTINLHSNTDGVMCDVVGFLRFGARSWVKVLCVQEDFSPSHFTNQL